MESLSLLNIEGNYCISKEAVGDLSSALPNCEIIHSDLKTQIELDMQSKPDEKSKAPASDTDNTENDTSNSDTNTDTEARLEVTSE